MTADSNTDVLSSEVRVYWWRDQRLDTEVPRSHGIGWASSDGRRYGALALRSDSRVLTDEQLEPLAAAELAGQPGLGLDVHLSSVRRRWTQAGAAVRIRAEGGQIVDADLRAHYGTRPGERRPPLTSTATPASSPAPARGSGWTEADQARWISPGVPPRGDSDLEEGRADAQPPRSVQRSDPQHRPPTPVRPRRSPTHPAAA